jgi:DNA mismatch repair protein MutL
VELGEKCLAYVMEHEEELSKAGFELEHFGGGSIVVKAVPALLGETNLEILFRKLADEFEQLGTSGAIQEVMKKIFAVVACHRQVRAGDRLSARELGALVREMDEKGVTHCPHGRPAAIRIPAADIEKMFKRR